MGGWGCVCASYLTSTFPNLSDKMYNNIMVRGRESEKWFGLTRDAERTICFHLWLRASSIKQIAGSPQVQNKICSNEATVFNFFHSLLLLHFNYCSQVLINAVHIKRAEI